MRLQCLEHFCDLIMHFIHLSTALSQNMVLFLSLPPTNEVTHKPYYYSYRTTEVVFFLKEAEVAKHLTTCVAITHLDKQSISYNSNTRIINNLSVI